VTATPDRIAGLDNPEATEVLKELLLQAQLRDGRLPELVDLEARLPDDIAFLRGVAQHTGIDATSRDEASAQRLLQVLTDEIPATREPAAEAIESLDERETSLDFGTSIALASLAIAVSAAIIRPLITIDTERDGAAESKKVRMEIRGINNLDRVLKAVLPFLPK
jgi:hypothetical protein